MEKATQQTHVSRTPVQEQLDDVLKLQLQVEGTFPGHLKLEVVGNLTHDGIYSLSDNDENQWLCGEHTDKLTENA